MATRLASRFQSGGNEIKNVLTDRFSYSVYISEALRFNLPVMDNMLLEQAPTDQNKLITDLRNLSIDVL